MLQLFSSCALFSHKPAGHISVKAVSWKLVKKYAEPEAGLAGHKITIIDPSDGRVVAEKLTDNLGYAIETLLGVAAASVRICTVACCTQCCLERFLRIRCRIWLPITQ